MIFGGEYRIRTYVLVVNNHLLSHPSSLPYCSVFLVLSGRFELAILRLKILSADHCTNSANPVFLWPPISNPDTTETRTTLTSPRKTQNDLRSKPRSYVAPHACSIELPILRNIAGSNGSCNGLVNICHCRETPKSQSPEIKPWSKTR